jgi:hypothetical protein
VLFGVVDLLLDVFDLLLDVVDLLEQQIESDIPFIVTHS